MSKPSPDPAIGIIRYEERLTVSTQQYATERIRLERIIVTEQRTISTEVRREEIRITREPLPDGTPTPARSGDSVPEPIVMVLHEEQISILKTVVPVEQVTVHVRKVTDDQQVTAVLSREEIDPHPAVNHPPDRETWPDR